jgi:hypothetical protein
MTRRQPERDDGDAVVVEHMTGPTFVLTLVAMEHELPAVIRLRALLKRSWREMRLKCVAIREEHLK